MHSPFKTTLISALIALGAAAPAAAQSESPNLFQRAETYMAQGQNAAAEEVLNRILADQPDRLDALLKRGTLRAWRGAYAEARTDYDAVLRQQPNNLEAIIGRGYTFAWAGDYAAAEAEFRRAQAIAPENIDAQKGLAYTALWRGDSATSVELFQALEATNPGNPEAAIAIGQAELQALHARRAEQAFLRALEIDADNTVARQGLQAAYATPARAELSVWVGNTTGAGSGLRQLELASWLARETRVWLRYDDSLTQDNRALSDLGANTEAYFFGALHQFNQDWIGVAEVGQRNLPDSQSQDVYKIEGVRLGQARSYKLGLQLAPHSEDYTDKLIYAGLNLPINPLWRFEPTFYLSESGATADREWRAVAGATYRDPSLWELSVNLGLGDLDAASSANSGSVNNTGLVWRMPIRGYHSIAISVQHQETPTDQSTTSMVGLTLRLPRI